ncbi:malonic semialdehyde reductase [Krasilnikovia sp. MM14-A1004]|uniref:malonic semialdehyde reductase n=1 Tax=Krasilnikovia sp. MM14-A1004 TaxID=3373541 RepID=UPI00399CB38B
MDITSEAVLTRPRLDTDGRALLFTDARTANSFADTPVTDTELAEIWELAKWPPTAANTQPLRVLYVRTPEGKQRLLPLMSDGNRDKTAAAPVTAVLAVDSQYHEHIPELFPHKPELKDVFAADSALRDGSGQFNAALQAGYFLLAVRAVGLVAGPMAGFDRAGVDAEFFADGRFRSLLVVNIGHPGENPWFGRLPRLPHTASVHWA